MADQLRLLICADCRTVDELPWYEGPPEGDVLLDQLVQNHQFPNGEEHIGGLANVSKRDWADSSKRAAIVKEITEKFKSVKEGTTGFESEFYATKSTYIEDAGKCFNAHRRPEVCIDWHSDKKRIGNPSRAGWQAGPKVFLCDFCPVKSLVDTEKRHRAGLYKEE